MPVWAVQAVWRVQLKLKLPRRQSWTKRRKKRQSDESLLHALSFVDFTLVDQRDTLPIASLLLRAKRKWAWMASNAH
jgi:hypothetical protein